MKINAEHGNGTGIGDCICLSWLPQIDEIFCTSKPRKQIFKLLGKKTTQDASNAHKMEHCWRQDLQGMTKQIPRLQSWCKALGIDHTPRQPNICLTDHAKQQAHRGVQHWGKQPIFLFPIANQEPRQWPISYWIDLAWKLHEQGEMPIMMLEHSPTKANPNGNRAEQLASRLSRVPKWLYGYSFDSIAGLIRQSKFVIANDSMGAHLAATLGKTTFAICGPTVEPVFAHYGDTVRIITADKERMPCIGCAFSNRVKEKLIGYRAACDQGCAALMQVTVDDVLEAIK